MQAIDALTLHYMALEATTLTQSAKINKIQHLSTHQWVFHFWGALSGASRLFIDMTPAIAAAWLTDDVRPFAPKLFNQPTGLSLLLRKHLMGARVIDTTTVPGERIWTWRFSQINELGQPVEWHLVLELMGKHSNMLLLQPDTQEVIALAHSVSDTMSTLRPLRPGCTYTLPPRPDKPTLWAVTPAQLADWLAEPPYAPALRQHVMGCSQYLWETILPDDNPPQQAVDKVLACLQPSGLLPSLHVTGKGFSLAPNPSDNWQAYPSVTTMVRAFFEPQLLVHTLQRHQHRLRQTLTARLNKLTHHIERLNAQAHSEVDYQALADSLMAQLYTLPAQPNAQQQVKLPGPNNVEAWVTLPLKPTAWPPHQPWMQGIQQLYALAKKQKTQEHIAQERAQQYHSQQEQLENWLCWVNNATDIDSLDALDGEINPVVAPKNRHVKASSLKSSKRKKTSHPVVSKPLLHRWQLSDEVELVMGKTQVANAYLLSQLAKPKDWWFHARQMAGGHVLVRCNTPQEGLSNTVIAQAAGLAAFYSQGQQSGRVPVVYTQCRHVRAIPNSYPGHVTYKQEAEVFVEPALPEASVLDIAADDMIN
jgi:predicted ribosome quality control (RQC) complex YloA/Tae2 family protein